MKNSKIGWTDQTWNPVTGCTKVSPGCAHCYAERIALRFGGKPYLPGKAEIVLHPERLDKPKGWRRPRMVFVNSMSDLFHEEVPDSFIDHVMWTIRTSPHTYQVLTKRAERMQDYIHRWVWDKNRAQPLKNLWLGVSVENARWKDRIKKLRVTPAAVRFLSCEPLLGSLGDLELTYEFPMNRQAINWVIAGGESGPRARVMNPDWAREIRDQCTSAGVPFFFKQWGGKADKRDGEKAVLDGHTWTEMPEDTRRRLGRHSDGL